MKTILKYPNFFKWLFLLITIASTVFIVYDRITTKETFVGLYGLEKAKLSNWGYLCIGIATISFVAWFLLFALSKRNKD